MISIDRLIHRIGFELYGEDIKRITDQLDSDWASEMPNYTPDVKVKIENNPLGICAIYYNFDTAPTHIDYLERIRINTGLSSELEKIKETSAKNLRALTADGTHKSRALGGDTDVYVHWGLLEEFKGATVDMEQGTQKLSDLVLAYIVREINSDRHGLFTYSPASKEKPYEEPSYATKGHMRHGAVPGLIIEGARPGYHLPDACLNFYKWPYPIKPLFEEQRFKSPVR